MLDDKDIKKLINVQKEVFVTKEEFEGLIEIVATEDVMKQGFDAIGKQLKIIDEKLDEAVVTKKEVDYIKNILNIPAIKK